MGAKSPSRRILLGVASGLLGGVLSLILAYVVSLVIIALTLRDLFATVLTALTFLPLMLIIIGVPVTFVLSVLTGGLLGIGAVLKNRPLGYLLGVLVAVTAAELVLSVVLPLIAPPQRGDFIHIASRPYLSASYGVVLGLITSLLFRWMDRENKG
jgi:hypothetical protein